MKKIINFFTAYFLRIDCNSELMRVVIRDLSVSN